MVGLAAIFYMFVFIFAIIGLMRGWARELIVTFSVVLGMFIITVLERFAPFISNTLTSGGSAVPFFWLRTFIIVGLIFFGYQTPNLPRLAGTGKFVRERLQDSLLGLFLGMLNGYLIVGTIWWFMNEAGYPFSMVLPPNDQTEAGRAALRLIEWLPPTWLAGPTIYFAVAVAFVFILVVFI